MSETTGHTNQDNVGFELAEKNAKHDLTVFVSICLLLLKRNDEQSKQKQAKIKELHLVSANDHNMGGSDTTVKKANSQHTFHNLFFFTKPRKLAEILTVYVLHGVFKRLHCQRADVFKFGCLRHGH